MIKLINFTVEQDKYDPFRVNIESKVCELRATFDKRSAGGVIDMITESKKSIRRTAEEYLFGDILEKVRECLTALAGCESSRCLDKLGDNLMKIVDLAKLKIKD